MSSSAKLVDDSETSENEKEKKKKAAAVEEKEKGVAPEVLAFFTRRDFEVVEALLFELEVLRTSNVRCEIVNDRRCA